MTTAMYVVSMYDVIFSHLNKPNYYYGRQKEMPLPAQPARPYYIGELTIAQAKKKKKTRLVSVRPPCGHELQYTFSQQGARQDTTTVAFQDDCHRFSFLLVHLEQDKKDYRIFDFLFYLYT